jgi:hypothetical protein
MAIKNKDGTIFQLQKPNPIMKDQEFWNDYILHNFNGEETIAIEQPQPPKKKYQNIEEIIPQEIKVPIKETPIPKKKPKEEPKKEEPPKTLLYCMPAITKHDKLYGEDRISYGPQFTLESIVIEMDDLTCKLWVNTNKVTENSILYMPRTIRWWKAEKITDNNNGHIIVCTPSTIQPDFSLKDN